ncbi:MAG: hypothetical protein ACXVIS_02270 [Halobacteriota archaeon]
MIVTMTVGCLDQAKQEPTVSAAATSTLKVSAPSVVNRSEYTTFSCQLNMTRGSGLDNKEIRWSIDNVYKETSRTVWGFAALNLTSDQTQGLTVGKHAITAEFAGDYDYAGSNSTTTFSVQTVTPTARTATPRPEDAKVSISLNVPNYSVKLGSATLTGTYSGLQRNQYLYVGIKAPGANTYKVQSPPITYLNGTYSVNVNFESSGNNEIVALVTSNTLSSITNNDVQMALTNSTGSVRVIQ